MTNTETLPPKDKFIDKLSTKEALNFMLANQSEVFKILEQKIDEIEYIIHRITLNLNQKIDSRLLYAGAGTSARIGVQDGAELYPTFSWPKHRLDFVIAGGMKSLTKSIENAEDNEDEAVKRIEELNVSHGDVLIGLAASGNTPFTVMAIKKARELGALTVGITNNTNTKIEEVSEISILIDTGFEALAGSTRLKAGTAQKICLNLISTMLMVQFGRVENGMMIQMKPNNKKLIQRQNFIKNIII